MASPEMVARSPRPWAMQALAAPSLRSLPLAQCQCRGNAGNMSVICSVEGCQKPSFGRKGWCNAHYKRWYRHGDPLGGGTAKRELQSYLQEVVLPFDRDECLTWPYTKNGGGYGQIRVGYKKLLVHRIVCEEVNGPPPTPKHEAAHNCGKGHLGCCAPKHLRWATRAENQADRHIHGTAYWGRAAKATALETQQ